MNKMLAISSQIGDNQNRFKSASFLGNVVEKVKVLAETGQLTLAYTMARTHNLTEFIEPLKKALEDKDGLDPTFFDQVEEKVGKAKAILPCRPIFIADDKFASGNWPHTMLSTMNIEDRLKQEPEPKEEMKDTFHDTMAESTLDNLLPNLPKHAEGDNKSEEDEPQDDMAGVDLGIDIDDDDDLLMGLEDDIAGEEPIDLDDMDKFEIPDEIEEMQKCVSKSLIAAFHAAMGNDGTALDLLKK